MTQLIQEKCVACRPDSPHVTDEEITELHPQVPEWELYEESGARRLRRRFAFPDFKSALEFSYRVGLAAEEEGHHPRITVDSAPEGGRVLVTWTTHAIRDLHRNDFIMAAKTDALYTSPLP